MVPLPGWSTVKRMRIPCNPDRAKLVIVGARRRLIVDLIALIAALTVPSTVLALAIIATASPLAIALLALTLMLGYSMVMRRIERIKLLGRLEKVLVESLDHYCGMSIGEAVEAMVSAAKNEINQTEPGDPGTVEARGTTGQRGTLKPAQQ